MPISNKKKLHLSSVSVDLGCGSCKRPRLSSIFNPKPKPSNNNYHKHYFNPTTITTTNNNYNSNSSSSSSYYTSTPSSSSSNGSNSSSTLTGFGRVGGESVAVEKDSDDPYLDFRQSMLQMILEKEIYSKDDLRELLNCFLQLNSPYYHGVIVRAFTEIWNGVFSVNSNRGGNNYNNININGGGTGGSALGGSGSGKVHYYNYGCNARDY